MGNGVMQRKNLLNLDFVVTKGMQLPNVKGRAHDDRGIETKRFDKTVTKRRDDAAARRGS